MKTKLSIFILVSALTFFCGQEVLAQDQGSNAARSFGLLDQVVKVQEIPKSSFVLQEAGLGVVHRYDATSVEAGLIESDDLYTDLHFGSVVTIPSLTKATNSHYVFLLHANGSFFATPVNKWTQDQVTQSKKLPQELRQGMQEELLVLHEGEIEQNDLAIELEGLRARASKTIDVKNLVTLSSDIQYLSILNAEKRISYQFLKKAVEKGADIPDPQESNQLRIELAHQLKSTAEATAMADRLAQQKQKAALANVRQQVALIREMKRYKLKALAQEVLRLRVRRKDLEEKLYGQALSEQDEF